MIEVKIGNIFDSKAQTIVNTVNCVGVMGKGIALEFKQRFPDMYKDYVQACNRNEIKLGKPVLYKRTVEPWILNFPTKDHWRSVARLEDIKNGLEYLLSHYKEWGIESIAAPPLGCGLGQLEWKVIGRTLYRYLKAMDIPVELYAPYGTPAEELQPGFLNADEVKQLGAPSSADPTWIQPPVIALVEILHLIEEEPYHWPVGRVIFQKIAYVATAEGLPTGLEFTKGSYGPYSPGLKKATTQLVNNGLIKEVKRGQMFEIMVGKTFKDAEISYKNDLEQWKPLIEKVADLFLRLDTRRAEIVATVLFAYNLLRETGAGITELDIVEAVMEWKTLRRPKLDRDDIAKTVRNLAALSWLDVTASAGLLQEEVLLEL